MSCSIALYPDPRPEEPGERADNDSFMPLLSDTGQPAYAMIGRRQPERAARMFPLDSQLMYSICNVLKHNG
jgi:hypothetical protein